MEQNKPYDIQFLPAALNDMSEIIAAFTVYSKQGANRILEKMMKASEQISHFPYSGITVPDDKLASAGYRMAVVEKYLMFYKIFEEEKQVLFYRVVNGSRNYPLLFGKLHTEE